MNTRVGIQITADSSGMTAGLSAAQRSLDQFGKQATSTFEKTGVSAAQTANAMRMIPAQMTDIGVSLQAGQDPLTVLLQQGGQLKDTFGGVGAALGGVGSYLRSLVSPLTLAAAGIGAVSLAFYQGSQEADAYRLAMVKSGNASGVTLSELQSMAKGLASVSGTQTEAAQTLAQFVQAGVQGRASLEQFSRTAMDWEKATGTAVKDTVANFVELGKDPLGASLKLNDSMHYLTASTYEQIKALVEQARMTEAVALAQNAYDSALRNGTSELIDNLGYAESAWKSVTGAAKKAWDSFLNIGREDSLQEKIDDLVAKLNSAKRRLEDARVAGIGGATGVAEFEVKGLDAQLAGLREKLRIEQDVAKTQSTQATLVSAMVKWDKDGEQFLDKKSKLEEAIKRTRQEGLAAGKSEEEIQKRINAIREKYKEPAKRPDTTYVKLVDDIALADQAAQQYLDTGESISTAERFRLETLKRINDEWLRGKLTLDQAVEAESRMNDAYGKQLEVLRSIEDAKQFDADQAENAKTIDATLKQTTTLNDLLEKEREHTAQLGLSKVALADLAAEKLLDQAASKDRLADLFAEIDLTGQMSAQYREQAQTLRDLAAAKKEGAAKETAIDDKKEADKLSKQAADTLRNDLKGAFSAAFRDSSGEPLKAFGDAIENVIFSRAATALADAAMQSADSFFGKGGGGSGAMDWLSSIFSFDGGGYTGSDSRTGGLDGKGGFMALLHPQETVVDHTKGQQAASAGAISVVQHINIDSRSDQATIVAAMQQAKAEVLSTIQQSRRAGGVYA